jgi:predicted RNA-binding protein with PIN domain
VEQPAAEQQDAVPAPALPAAVRERVVALVADALGGVPLDELPPSLRPVARFTPAKRARLAAGALAVAVEADVVLRQRVAVVAREALPELAAAVEDGRPPPAAPPVDVAALTYLLRPDGWQDALAAASARVDADAAATAADLTAETVQRLTEQLDALRAAGRAQAAEARRQLEQAQEQAAAAREEAGALRRRVRDLGDRAATAERALAGSEQRAAPEPPPEPDPEAGEVRRLRARLAEAESALTAARSATRTTGREQDVRLRLLLDAVVGAAAGLRRELALPPAQQRPADAVAEALGPPPDAAEVPRQGRGDDDPALLDALLAVPAVHVLVDGYNVTKTGYGDLPLEAQRSRLLAGLGALAARTGAETTVVFDGVDRTGPLAAPSRPAPRGVRLLFSRTGETADDVLRDLVRAEPPGRPLVVVTSDRAVVDDVRADGARTVDSRALLRLLER